jgi:hypothetical protein
MSTNSERKFQIAIGAAGLMPPTTFIADGQSHRFETSIQGHTIRAWYCLSPDMTYGTFGISGIGATWRNKA